MLKFETLLFRCQRDLQFFNLLAQMIILPRAGERGAVYALVIAHLLSFGCASIVVPGRLSSLLLFVLGPGKRHTYPLWP
jgi:hypothetical protein